MNHHQNKSISGCNLVTTAPVEGFTTRVKVSVYAGIALATPVWLWELWKFGGSGVVPLFSPSRYITLYTAMALIFGLVFMYPLLLISLELVGLVPIKTWRGRRRPAIVVICAVAAVITLSSDLFSFIAMAIPMLLFYEGSILVGRAMGK